MALHKAAFFDDLYDQSTEDEAEAESPSAPPRRLDTIESKSVQISGPQFSFDQNSDEAKMKQSSEATEAKEGPAIKRRRSSPEPPFYCMDDSALTSATRTNSNSETPHSSRSVSREPFVTEATAPLPAQLVKKDIQARRPMPWLKTSSSTVKANSRRKKKGPAELPEHQKIFRGLIFYYFPNSDVNPARKFRMGKAAERGAQRALEFSAVVTHIIVDSGYSYQKLLDHLGVSGISNEISVVNDYFPAECIEFGFLIDPLQSRFRAEGHVLAQPAQLGAARSPSPPEEQATFPADYGTTEKISNAPKDAGQEQARQTASMAHQSPAPKRKEQLRGPSGPSNIEEAIEEARQLSQLPIDSGSSDSESADAEEGHAVDASEPATSWQSNFQCMRAHPLSDSAGPPPNAPTIALLSELAAYYERTCDTWRVISYQRCMSALRRHPHRISSEAEARALPGIGPRLAAKIAEIASTARLRRLEHALNDDPSDQALQLFLGVYGAGPAQARAWIAQGHRTLDDLRANASLTPTQVVGVARHADFAVRIPRAEVTQHGALVQQVLGGLDPRAAVTISGSYRRGAATSGDIDFLVTGDAALSAAQLRALLFERLVPALFAAGYLQCALALPSAAAPSRAATQPSPSAPCAAPSSTAACAGSKFHGAALLPPPAPHIWRRVDFLAVPHAEHGAATLYFTGSALFNRSMRLLARRKGWRLNQHGLFVRNAGADGARADGRGSTLGAGTDEGRVLEARSERRIFALLGVPWREPRERNC